MKIESPGKYKMSSKEYMSDPVITPSLSRSTIKDLLFNSPARAWFNNERLNPNHHKAEKETFDIGTAAHALLLEGIDKVVVIEHDDWRTKKAKEEKDDARKSEKVPLLRKQYDEVLEMVEAAKKQIIECDELGITDLSKEGESELTYVWQEKEIWLRIRPDWIGKDKKLILDYKTTGISANPENISRHIVSMAYDIQDALYLRGVKNVEKNNPVFVFIFQETEKPYLCSFISLPPVFSEMGKQKVEYGIHLWQQCLSSNIWEGYPKQVCYPEPPAWSLAHWESIAAQIE